MAARHTLLEERKELKRVEQLFGLEGELAVRKGFSEKNLLLIAISFMSTHTCIHTQHTGLYVNEAGEKIFVQPLLLFLGGKLRSGSFEIYTLPNRKKEEKKRCYKSETKMEDALNNKQKICCRF